MSAKANASDPFIFLNRKLKPTAIAEGKSVTKKLIPKIPVTEAICTTGRKLDCVYDMLPAVPSGENLIIRNSNKHHNAGKAKADHPFRFCKTIFLFSNAINANTRGSKTVKNTATAAGNTLSK